MSIKKFVSALAILLVTCSLVFAGGATETAGTASSAPVAKDDFSKPLTIQVNVRDTEKSEKTQSTGTLKKNST
jgi:hypothetical protein